MKIILDVTSDELQTAIRLMDLGVQNPAVGLKVLESPSAANFVMKLSAAVKTALAEEAKPKRKAKAKPVETGNV